MRNRRHVAAVMAVLLAVTVSLAGCGGDAGSDGEAQGGEPIRIGAVLSLSGTYSGLGTPEKQAIELEVERINDSGGIDGRPLQVVFEDDATDPAKAVAAATRLIERENVVAVIGATGTGQTMALRDECVRAQIPVVSMAGGSVVTDDFSEWVFQTPWPNRIVVPFTLEQLAERGLTRVGVISDSGGYGADGHAIIVAEAAGAGVEIVADETFNPGDTDMTAQLTKIRGAEPDAVLMWNAGKEAAIVAQNMAQLGFDVPLVGSPGNGRVEFIDGAGDAAEGFRFAAGKILVPEAYGDDVEAYDVATGFIERFTERYDKAPDIFAGHAYDAIWVVADALDRLEGDIDPVALRDAIEQTSGLVGVGGTFTYAPNDHNGLSTSELVFYRIENGTWVLDE
ncbi:MAG: ABC transporter substrate-binding protein [Anaerosomatales bacterium]|nr:ABC transporter substrate-binding protein [Anaerosomatales bacterium]